MAEKKVADLLVHPARFRITGILFLFIVLVSQQAAYGQSANLLGPLAVRVTSAGQPVANTTVCIGVTNDLNLFHQGTTDEEGRVHFSSVPREPFIATAAVVGRGAQRFYSPASPNVPLFFIDLVLPVTGGPSCPTTPPGPSRTAVSRITEMPAISPVIRPPVTLTRTEFCFGALGDKCGQLQPGIPATALCAGGFCFVNGGSWDHDECCFAHPHGMACQLGPIDAITGHDGNCVAAWNKAVRLAAKKLFWMRAVDFSLANTSGTVEFEIYCAPGNSLVPPEDARKCCSGQTRPLNFAESAVAIKSGETLSACR